MAPPRFSSTFKYAGKTTQSRPLAGNQILATLLLLMITKIAQPMKASPYIMVFLLAATAYSCVQPPDYPEAPVLTYEGFNKRTIPQGSSTNPSDTLELRLSFTDGDGDLGRQDTIFDVFITDSRDGTSEVRKLPVIPEQGVGNGISGEIRLRFPNQVGNLCCIYPPGPINSCEPNPNQPVDSFYYEVFIIDRDGNESNVVQTETVTLLCN